VLSARLLSILSKIVYSISGDTKVVLSRWLSSFLYKIIHFQLKRHQSSAQSKIPVIFCLKSPLLDSKHIKWPNWFLTYGFGYFSLQWPKRCATYGLNLNQMKTRLHVFHPKSSSLRDSITKSIKDQHVASHFK